MKAELVRVVQEWINQAEEDFKNAEHTLALGEDCPVGTVAFHGQQCVEKYLKALLTLYSTRFAKTHDLNALRLLLPGNVSIGLDVEELERASRFAVESRYPGGLEPVTRGDAERVFDLAKRVREAVRPLFPEECLEKR